MNSRSINLLLVEDTSLRLERLKNFCERMDNIVHIAEGYQMALEVARREKVDFAICDINLWDGNGLRFAPGVAGAAATASHCSDGLPLCRRRPNTTEMPASPQS